MESNPRLDSPSIAELKELQEDHDRLTLLLQATEQEIEKITSHLKHEHNRNLPISHLPVELISRIFCFASVLEERRHGRGSWSYQDDLDEFLTTKETAELKVRSPHLPFELRISQVCSDWNSIAKDTYSLWQTLALPRHQPKYGYPYTTTPPRQCYDFECGYVRRYIQNSKSSPLTIRIHLTIFDLWHDIWPILRPTVYRWKRLSISSGDYYNQRTVFPVLNDLKLLYAPILEDLCIQNTRSDFQLDREDDWDRNFDLKEDKDEGKIASLNEESILKSEPKEFSHPKTWEQRQSPLAIFTGGTPMLKSLRTTRIIIVAGPGCPSTALSPNLRPKASIMPTLTTLFFHIMAPICWYPLPCNLADILLCCPSLQHLSIEGNIKSAVTHEPSHKVALPSLKSLRLVGSPMFSERDGDFLGEGLSFYQYFTTPNLKSLTITRLEQMDRFLHAMQTVTTLRLENCFRGSTFVKLYMSKLPAVRRLDVVYTTPSRVSDKYEFDVSSSRHADSILRRVLSLRRPIWPRLHEIQIWTDSPECIDLFKLRTSLLRRKELTTRGLRLRINDSPRTMPRFLLKDCVDFLEVVGDKMDRPATFPSWEDVLEV